MNDQESVRIRPQLLVSFERSNLEVLTLFCPPCRSGGRTVARLTKRQVLTASGFTLPTPRLFAGRFVFSDFNTYTLHV